MNDEFRYIEASAEDVAQYFAKGYEPFDGETLVLARWFFDPHKDRFIFKISVSRAAAASPSPDTLGAGSPETPK